jgi:hypothetical protein
MIENKHGFSWVYAAIYMGGCILIIAIGEPLDRTTGLTWRNVVALCMFPWVWVYFAYNAWKLGRLSQDARDRMHARIDALRERGSGEAE